MKSTHTVKVDIIGCARCGNNHEQLEFRPFIENQIIDYKYWSLCPVNKEPVLLRLEEITEPYEVNSVLEIKDTNE